MTQPREPHTQTSRAPGSAHELGRDRHAGTTPAAGATEAARSGGGNKWWLWALLALIVLAALIFGLTQCSNNSDRDAAAPPPANSGAPTAGPGTPTAGPGTPTANGPNAGETAPGMLSAGGRALLPVAAVAGANGELTGLVGQQASAQAVPVQSVPADEGFWVGNSETDRMWVKLVPDGESPIKVQKGQLLDLGGPVVAHGADFAGAEGVDDAEGAAQLTTQAAHIEAPQGQVRVVGTR